MGSKNRKQGTHDEENLRSKTEVKTTTIRLASFNIALFSMALAIHRNIAELSPKKDPLGEHEDAQNSVVETKGKSVIGSSSSQVLRSILRQFPSSKDT
ncbi:hypothetical protein KI387_044473, partial [Taxus chinensis]